MASEESYTLQDLKAAGSWQIGYCHSAGFSGAYVLFWPLTTRSWDIEFWPRVIFDGNSTEDVYFVSAEETAVWSELDAASIEWARDEESARRKVVENFPKSRVANDAARLLRWVRVKPKPLGETRDVLDAHRSDPWM